MTEAAIQKEICASLEAFGFARWDARRGDLEEVSKSRGPGVFWRNNITPGRQTGGRTKNPTAGTPDIEGILWDGRYLGIEVKRPGGKLRETQRQFLYLASTATRAVVMVVESADEALACLRNAGAL